mgnify:CR=1 FL=1
MAKNKMTVDFSGVDSYIQRLQKIPGAAEKAITAIKNGGYATDPSYISKIMNIIMNMSMSTSIIITMIMKSVTMRIVLVTITTIMVTAMAMNME